MKATTSVCGPYDDVEIPLGSEKTDWEVELGVVIGKPAKYVGKESALDHIAGYCIVNDVSERAFQIERGGQWDKGKCCDTFAPIGPWLVTGDEVGDPQALDLWLDVDGKRYQHGSTRTMIFDVATLVSYISHFMRLQPGDVISTGTPPGVGLGQKPPDLPPRRPDDAAWYHRTRRAAAEDRRFRARGGRGKITCRRAEERPYEDHDSMQSCEGLAALASVGRASRSVRRVPETLPRWWYPPERRRPPVFAGPALGVPWRHDPGARLRRLTAQVFPQDWRPGR